MTHNNLCSTCKNIGCEFQSGIVRTKCAFYMPPHSDDVISREWLKTAIHNFYYGLKHIPSEEDIQAYIDAAPSVTQKSGKWIDIPDNATNGDVIKAIFPNSDIEEHRTYMKIVEGDYLLPCAYQWWNAPYCGDHMKGANR